LSSGVTLATNRPDLRCAVALVIKTMCATLCYKSTALYSPILFTWTAFVQVTINYLAFEDQTIDSQTINY
jgi:hypothetical protein